MKGQIKTKTITWEEYLGLGFAIGSVFIVSPIFIWIDMPSLTTYTLVFFLHLNFWINWLYKNRLK